MEEDEVQQFEIDALNALESAFGFRIGNDERIHAGDNIQEQSGHMSLGNESKEHRKSEGKKKQADSLAHRLITAASKQEKQFIRLYKNYQETINNITDLEHKFLNNEITENELHEGYAQTIKRLNNIADEYDEMDTPESKELAQYMRSMADNYQEISDTLKTFKNQDPEAYNAYLDYRRMAKDTITIIEKLPNDPEGSAHPMVYKIEGEYYVQGQDGTEYLVKDLPHGKEHLADIERQEKNGGIFFGKDAPEVKEWQEKFSKFHNAETTTGKALLGMHNRVREWKNVVKMHKEGAQELRKQYTETKSKYDALGDDTSEEERTAVKQALDELQQKRIEVAQTIRGGIAEDPQLINKLLKYAKDNAGTYTDPKDFLKNMPPALQTSLAKMYPDRENLKPYLPQTPVEIKDTPGLVNIELGKPYGLNKPFNTVANPELKTETTPKQTIEVTNLEETKEIKRPTKSFNTVTNSELENTVSLRIEATEEKPSRAIEDGKIMLIKDDGTHIPSGLSIDENGQLIMNEDSATGVYVTDQNLYERRNANGTTTPVDVKIEQGQGGINIEINDIIQDEQNARLVAQNTFAPI